MIPFAPEGSKVHELEHEAGGVKRLDIANVVATSSSSLATKVGIVDVMSTMDSEYVLYQTFGGYEDIAW